MLSLFRCVIYLMMSFPPECVPLSYVSYVLHCLLDCVPSLYMASAFYCHVHPGYVLLSCVDCFILSFRFGMLFTIQFVICFILSSPPVMFPFMLWVLGFILSCAVGSRSPSGVSYVLYCHVHHMFFFIPRVLCFTSHCLFGLLSSSDVSLCVIMSCPSGICYFIPCNMFSDCSVHLLTCRVDSTRRAKCTITICTKSDVVIRYSPTKSP
jgi:hypothetical protein